VVFKLAISANDVYREDDWLIVAWWDRFYWTSTKWQQSSGREVRTTAAFASYWAMCEHSWWYLNTRPD